MEFVTEWKSRWPINSTFSAPLLIQNKNNQETTPPPPFGPLIFSPSLNSSSSSSSTLLLQSPDICPRLPPPYPQLSCSQFLHDYTSGSASSIPSLVGTQPPDYSSCFHSFNSLQLLQIPSKNLIVAFFPAGDNSNCVGFSLLSVRDGILSVPSQTGKKFQECNVNHQRINLLLVNPAVDDDFLADETGDGHKVFTVGFLMVCTHYSVYWYRVRITPVHRRQRDHHYSVCLDYLGCANAKVLRGATVVSACWSPHMKEECLVLLENGDLLLFDVTSFGGKQQQQQVIRSIFPVTGKNNNRVVVNTSMHISLTDKLGLLKEESGSSKGRDWFKCEFSWHPRILIVSHRTEVFLVDLRSPSKCNVRSLLKIEMLSVDKNDGFFALSRVHSDGFFFTVTTKTLLLLCDVRKPLMPVLRWAHGIQNPRYVTVFRLSELRANAAEDTKYKLASESGYCIMLGSFWDNEFSVFCYGPDRNGIETVSSKCSKLCNPCYAWGLPSKLSLSDFTCKCGSCVVREEFTEMALPSWIDWRQKKQLVLGFGILEADIYAQLSSHNNSFGGFMLIRLTSLGKLEAQHYHAAWESENFLGAGHKRKIIYLDDDDNLLYDRHNSEYDEKKKLKHVKLEALRAFLNGKLEKHIVKRRNKMKDSYEGNAQKKRLVKTELDFHPETILSTVLKDISMPTTIHEIALSSMFSALPANLRQCAYSTNTNIDKRPEYHDEPLECIPDQPQVPPYLLRKPSDRSNKSSSKVQPAYALVGPNTPLFLTTLYNLWVEERKAKRDLYLEGSEAFSIQARFKRQCDKVMEVVQEHILGSRDKTRDDNYVPLADDTEPVSNATQKMKLSCHEPSAFTKSSSSVDPSEPGSEVCMFSTHVFRRSQELRPGMVGKELFNVGCPIELKFSDCNTKCGPKELKLFQDLKKHNLDFQKRFKPYRDYISRQDE